MNKRLVLGAVIAYVVIFNAGYVFHEILCAEFFKASFGPGVQRDAYIVPVIALAFAIYVTLMALAYPVAHLYFAEKRRLSKVATGAILGLFCGFLWDSLQGGIIEYATYHVSLGAMLVDSTYHTLEGVVAGTILGAMYRPRTLAARA